METPPCLAGGGAVAATPPKTSSSPRFLPWYLDSFFHSLLTTVVTVRLGTQIVFYGCRVYSLVYLSVRKALQEEEQRRQGGHVARSSKQPKLPGF